MNKTLKREYRLRSVKDWKNTYSGNNIVKGYSKKYSIDKLCAVKELRMIGFEITEEYENQLQKSLESHVADIGDYNYGRLSNNRLGY